MDEAKNPQISATSKLFLFLKVFFLLPAHHANTTLRKGKAYGEEFVPFPLNS